MQKWIALFRGINVGGKNVLPMSELRSDLKGMGLENIRTYIQSGNVVFDSESKNVRALAQAITERIQRQRGFGPRVLIISRKDLQLAIKANPFPDAVSDPQSLHFFFLDDAPATPNLKALDEAKAPTEAYMIKGKLFFLHAPEGVGRSKLAASAEKYLGVAVTARNYRTVEKIAALAEQT